MRFAFAFAVCAVSAMGESVTFYRDVLPVLQKNCQECHRPGEIGPMPLLSYDQARPWAKSIKQAVLAKKMPPWFADPSVGHFRNDRSLSQKEIDTLVAWVDGGTAAGDAKQAPPPLQFVDGWNIGKPDVVFEMPVEYHVPATGVIDYTYIIVPTGFKQDMWVKRAEVRPGDRTVMHHANIDIRPPASQHFREYPAGVPFVPVKGKAGGASLGDELLCGFVPGKATIDLPDGYARLVPAGSDLVFQLHYTTTGKPSTDRTKIGLIFATEPPVKRVSRIVASNATFAIPPGDPDYHVDGDVTLKSEVELVTVKPHMHLRGKWMNMRAVYPTGESEDLLKVPHYDFNWQLEFILDKPKMLPKGTRLEAFAGFDNSPNNPFNPDPTKTVRWGDQSFEEMMGAFFEIAFSPKMSSSDVIMRTPRKNPVPVE